MYIQHKETIAFKKWQYLEILAAEQENQEGKSKREESNNCLWICYFKSTVFFIFIFIFISAAGRIDLGDLVIFAYDQRFGNTPSRHFKHCSTISRPIIPTVLFLLEIFDDHRAFFTQLQCVESNRSKTWDLHYSFSQPQAALIRLCEIAFQGDPTTMIYCHSQSRRPRSLRALKMLFQLVTSLIRLTETSLYFPPHFSSTLLGPYNV